MKKLYIHCDGGFGNRFNSLVIGLIICQRGEFTPVISWPSTNVCRALYDDIFEDEFEFNSNRLEEYSDSINQFEFVMHDNQLNWNVKIISPYSYASIGPVKYKGLNTHERAILNKEKFSGCTVHYVTSKLDSGKIILQKKVKIFKNDTAKRLQKRVLKQEHKIYPKALNMIIN